MPPSLLHSAPYPPAYPHTIIQPHTHKSSIPGFLRSNQVQRDLFLRAHKISCSIITPEQKNKYFSYRKIVLKKKIKLAFPLNNRSPFACSY